MVRMAWALGAACLVAVVVVLGFRRIAPSRPPPEPPAPGASLVPDLAVADLVHALDEPERRLEALVHLGRRGEGALPAVARLVVLLGDTDAHVQWLAADALGRIGPAAAAPAEPALMAAHAASRDAVLRFAVERALAKTGGWSRFRHEIPEEITFLERPYLRVVEEAERRVWLQGEDAAVAERCWRQTLEHQRRLNGDRLHRLGEQTHALATNGVRFAFEATWSPPFLVCASDGTERPDPSKRDRPSSAPRVRPLAETEAEPRRFDALLRVGAEAAQAVYRNMLRRHGPIQNLQPLEAEYGGRPDYAKTVRSYADGFPVVLWIWTSPAARERAARLRPRDEWEAAGRPVFAVPDDVVEVAAHDAALEEGSLDVEHAAFAACEALLNAWLRQANRWNKVFVGVNPITVGICAEQAGWRRDEGGELGFTGAPRSLRRGLLEYAVVARKRGLSETPRIPVGEFLEMRSYSLATEWLASKGLPPSLGVMLYRCESWALVRFLGKSAEPRHRAALEDGLRAVLHRQEPAEAVRRALDVRDGEDWGPIDAAFGEWLRAQTTADAPGDAVAEVAPAGVPR